MILAGSVNACDVSECQDDSQGLLQLMKAKHRDPWCSASPGCSKLGLAGACCPTAGGLYLHCCRGGTSHNDTTMQSTTAVHSKPTTSFRTQTTHLTTTEPTTSYMTQATHTTTTIRNRPSAVQLSCSGEGFLDCWTFFTKADPTHGYIQYATLLILARVVSVMCTFSKLQPDIQEGFAEGSHAAGPLQLARRSGSPWKSCGTKPAGQGSRDLALLIGGSFRCSVNVPEGCATAVQDAILCRTPVCD